MVLFYVYIVVKMHAILRKMHNHAVFNLVPLCLTTLSQNDIFKFQMVLVVTFRIFLYEHPKNLFIISKFWLDRVITNVLGVSVKNNKETHFITSAGNQLLKFPVHFHVAWLLNPKTSFRLKVDFYACYKIDKILYSLFFT